MENILKSLSSQLYNFYIEGHNYYKEYQLKVKQKINKIIYYASVFFILYLLGDLILNLIHKFDNFLKNKK